MFESIDDYICSLLSPYFVLHKHYFSFLCKNLKNRYFYFILQVRVLRFQFSSVQLFSCVWLFVTPWITAHQASLSITNSQSLSKLMSIESQPTHLLPSPSPPAPNPSQHQGLFQWTNSSHEVAKVLDFQLQHQSFRWIPRTGLLQDGLFGSPCSPRYSQESSPAPRFKSINSLALSFLHIPALTSIHDHWKNHRRTFVGKVMSLLFNMLSRFVINFLQGVSVF